MIFITFLHRRNGNTSPIACLSYENIMTRAAVLITVATILIALIATPTIALLCYAEFQAMIPRAKPAMATGSPQIGKSHAISE